MNPFSKTDLRTFAIAMVFGVLGAWALVGTFGRVSADAKPLSSEEPIPADPDPAPVIQVPAKLLTDDVSQRTEATQVSKKTPDLACPCYAGKPCNCPCSVSLKKVQAELEESQRIRASREAEWTKFFNEESDWRRSRGFGPLRRDREAVNNGFNGEGKPETGQYGETQSFNSGRSLKVENSTDGGWRRVR